MVCKKRDGTGPKHNTNLFMIRLEGDLILFGFCAILLMIELCLFVFKEANSSRFTLQKFTELSEAGSCLDVSQTHVTQE